MPGRTSKARAPAGPGPYRADILDGERIFCQHSVNIILLPSVECFHLEGDKPTNDVV